MYLRLFLATIVYLANLSVFAVSAADWPMRGRDAGHTHFTPTPLPDEPSLLWVRELPPPRRAWAPQRDDFDKLEFDLAYTPVAMDGLLFVPSMVTDSVTAYRLDTGEQVWRTVVDGPVRLAPAATEGLIIFTSDDGRVYALDARTGEQRWVFQAAPDVHKVLGNERLISMWPARGAPVIFDGKVYLAAGIWPFQGIFLYALDAATGQLIWENAGDGDRWMAQPHGGAYSYANIAPQGYLTATEDHLAVSGGRSPPAIFNRHTGAFIGAELRSKAAGPDRPAGGYRLKTDGRFLYNHGQRLRLRDASQAGRLWVDVIDGNIAYHGSMETLTATAIDPGGNMQRLWSVTVPGLRGLHLKAGGSLYADGHDGRILVIDVSADIPITTNEPPAVTISELTERVDAPVTSMLAAGGTLVAVTERGTIHAFGAPVSAPRSFAYRPEPIPATSDDATWKEQIDRLLAERPGARAGYGLVIGGGSDALINALLLQTDLNLLVTEPSAAIVAALRERLIEAGVYGSRVAVLPGTLETAALPPYIFSLIVATRIDPGNEPASAENARRIVRHLRPYDGVALLPREYDTDALASALAADHDLGEVVLAVRQGLLHVERRGPLPGAGEWTHQYANAANTVLSRDRRVRAPLGVLWFGGPGHDNILPRHAAGPRPQVAGGRLAILGVETISVRDVYTGREIWVREFPGIGHPFTNLELEEKWLAGEVVYMSNQPGAAYIGSPYVSLSDAIYVRHSNTVHRLEPATGATIAVFPLPGIPKPGEPDWGHISVTGDTLVTTVNPHIFEDGHLGELNWDASSSEKLVALNRFSGDILWTREARTGFRHNAIVSANGRIFVIDGISEQARGFLGRRGRLPTDHSVLVALDLRTGEKLWEQNSDIFGTFLSYSAEHDILIEGGTRDARRHLPDEPHERMAARRGSDGERIWERHGPAEGPVILHGTRIIPARPGIFRNLLTGEDEFQPDPLTGEIIEAHYWKAYGCGTASAGENLLLFRSGAAGYFDLENNTGTATLGGFKSGCTANLIPADGILSAPDYTRTCTCSYQNQTSLGLIHMPWLDTWSMHSTLSDPEPGALRQAGINFGAPGSRMDDQRTLWVEYPPAGAPSPNLSLTVEPADALDTFRLHPLRIDGHPLRWVGASGITGMRSIRIAGLQPPAENVAYSVKLYFVEPHDVLQRDRIFDVWIQNNLVKPAFDTIGETGATRRLTTMELRGVRPVAATTLQGVDQGAIEIEFDPAMGALYEPLICGLEISIEPNRE